MPWNTMIDGTSVRQNAAATGPTTPPLPPARLTPPSTTAATEFSVMKLPAYGVPMPVVAAAARPPMAATQAQRQPHRQEHQHDDDHAGGDPGRDERAGPERLEVVGRAAPGRAHDDQ